MICTFFGHKDAPNFLTSELKKAILEVIEKKNATFFYVGNNGNFDFLVQKVLKEISQSCPDIQYRVVLSVINENALIGDENITLFPEKLELSPPKFAIYKRNEWMLQQANLVIAYVKYSTSNAYKWITKAEKKGLSIINLANSSKNNP